MTGHETAKRKIGDPGHGGKDYRVFDFDWPDVYAHFLCGHVSAQFIGIIWKWAA